MSVLAAIAGGASLLGGLFSSQASAAANRRAKRLLRKQQRDNEAWYRIQNNTDYTLRSDVQAAINKQRELLNERYKIAEKSAVVTGAADEAVAAQKAAANDAMANTMQGVAADAAAHKDRVDATYRATKSRLADNEAGIAHAEAEANAKAGAQLMNAGIGMVAQGAESMGDNSEQNAILHKPHHLRPGEKVIV